MWVSMAPFKKLHKELPPIQYLTGCDAGRSKINFDKPIFCHKPGEKHFFRQFHHINSLLLKTKFPNQLVLLHFPKKCLSPLTNKKKKRVKAL